MAGEHAQKDMGAHPRAPANGGSGGCADRRSSGAEGALDAGEALIGADHALAGQSAGFDTGADHIKPVEPGFGGDAVGIAGKAETVFGNRDVEQLGELVAGARSRPTARAILSWSLRPAPRVIWSASLVNSSRPRLEAAVSAARSRAVASLEAGETRRLAINASASGTRRSLASSRRSRPSRGSSRRRGRAATRGGCGCRRRRPRRRPSTACESPRPARSANPTDLPGCVS